MPPMFSTKARRRSVPIASTCVCVDEDSREQMEEESIAFERLVEAQMEKRHVLIHPAVTVLPRLPIPLPSLMGHPMG